MKFSVITLACLASFAATAYANVIQQRDDDTFKSALKLALSDLEAAVRVVHNYKGENYTFPRVARAAQRNFKKSLNQVEESRTLSEAGCANIKPLFIDLEAASKALLNEFIAKKPTIEANSKCRVSYAYMLFFRGPSIDLVRAIIRNSEDRDFFYTDAQDYLENLRLTLLELEEPKYKRKGSQ